MKRVAAALTGAMLIGALATVVPSQASGAAPKAPTVSAASSVKYYTDVPITGTTQLPNQHVVVYIRTAATKYHAVRDLHSDASRHFSAKIRAAVTFAVLARAGGVNSAARTVHLVSAKCTTGGALFTKFPFPTSPHVKNFRDYDFAEATANRNGTLAGVMYQSYNGEFRLYERLKGHAPAVHATFAYRNVTFDVPGSVHVVGITAANAVVAAVQDPSSHPRNQVDVRVRGEYWAKGHAHLLQHAASWTSWAPTAVTDSGRVVGYVSTGNGNARRYYAAYWPSVTSKAHVLARAVNGVEVTADGQGDIAWYSTNGYGYVRTRDGVTHRLSVKTVMGEDYTWELGTLAASRTAIYTSTQNATVAFRLTGHVAAGAVSGVAVAQSTDIQQVGPNGSLLLGDVQHPFLITAKGARVTLPAQYKTYSHQPTESPGWTISAAGNVAYTGADRRVHVLSCR